MPITINGSGTVTGLSAGGLPDGSITSDDIAAGAVTAAKLAAGAGGKMLQVQSSHTSTASNPTSATDLLTINLTTVQSSATSKIILIGNLTHGLGPASTNLDTYGFSLALRENGSAMVAINRDVFAGSGLGATYGPEYDVQTVVISTQSQATWSAGQTITYALRIAPEGAVGNFINRAYASTGSKGVTSLIVMEVAQ